MRWTEEEYIEWLKRINRVPTEKPKKPKYRNNRVKVDGILFDSQLEADYYNDLKLRLMAGDISGFCRQPEFVLQEGFGDIRPIVYRADFIIFDKKGYEIIDTKGFETDEFKLKKKLFQGRFTELELKVERGG